MVDKLAEYVCGWVVRYSTDNILRYQFMQKFKKRSAKRVKTKLDAYLPMKKSVYAPNLKSWVRQLV
jgi:hypothetical protein